MVEFKLCINDPKDGKSYTKEVKDQQADMLLNKRIGQTVAGDDLGFAGYEFKITGGSDTAGFPLRSGVPTRKKILTQRGVGFRGKNRWKKTDNTLYRKKTVSGATINNQTRLVNIIVTKAGAQTLAPPPEEKPAQ